MSSVFSCSMSVGTKEKGRGKGCGLRGQVGLSHARSRNSTWSGPHRSRPFKTSAALLASSRYSFSFLVFSSSCQRGTACPSCAGHTYSAVLETTDTNARLTLARRAPASLRPLLLAPFLAAFSYLASLNAPSPRVVCTRDRLLGLHRSTSALACPRLARTTTLLLRPTLLVQICGRPKAPTNPSENPPSVLATSSPPPALVFHPYHPLLSARKSPSPKGSLCTGCLRPSRSIVRVQAHTVASPSSFLQQLVSCFPSRPSEISSSSKTLSVSFSCFFARAFGELGDWSTRNDTYASVRV